MIDAYRRTNRGFPTPGSIDRSMLVGVQVIDFLNPKYAFKLGLGRIYIPWALNAPGLRGQP